MNWVISCSFGPTDTTRAMLPFLFAASAVQAGDTVTLMLFHDAVLMAVEGVGKTLVPSARRTASRRLPAIRTSRFGPAGPASRCAALPPLRSIAA
jgi:predicted peroxiredoxin